MRVEKDADIYSIIDAQSASELEQLKGRYERLSLLYHVGNVIHSTLDPQEAGRRLAQRSAPVELARSSASGPKSAPVELT